MFKEGVGRKASSFMLFYIIIVSGDKEMKMRIKMLVLAIIPLFVLGFATIFLSNSRIFGVIRDNIENGLRGTAISVRDSLALVGDGKYSVDQNMCLYNGDFNITEHTEIADNIKNATDMDITIFYGDTRYMTSVRNDQGERVVGTKAGEVVTEKVVKDGEEYFATNVDVAGQPFFGYYLPLIDANGDIVGMIFSGMPQADALKEINRITIMIIVIMAVVLFICAVVLFFVVGKMVAGLEACVKVLDNVSAGKLNEKVDDKLKLRKDEVGKISKAVDKLQDKLLKIISEIKKDSDALIHVSDFMDKKTIDSRDNMERVEKAIEEIALGAENQASDTQNLTESIIVMGNMIEDNVQEIENLNTSAEKIKQRGEVVIQTLKELQGVNEDAKEAIKIIYNQTNETNVSAQKIKEAIEIITDIAEETNLLSLNASIEAARAGEQGRGFAVVASQIQKLAEQSNESAKQIEAIVSLLLCDSEKAVNTMNEVNSIVEKQNVQVSETDAHVVDVLREVEGAIEAIGETAKKTGIINTTRNSVVDTVQSLAAIAEENAASTQETSASSIEISDIIVSIAENAGKLKIIAKQMNENISVFEV